MTLSVPRYDPKKVCLGKFIVCLVLVEQASAYIENGYCEFSVKGLRVFKVIWNFSIIEFDWIKKNFNYICSVNKT